MLRVAKVAAGGHTYYLEVASGGSGTGVEEAGRWLGRGSPVLGLAGVVAEHDLAAVLAGRDPSGGEVLGRAHHRVRVAAFDLTFCAPKSVSLLHALGGPEITAAVGAGHGAAVDAALCYVERHALGVRRTGPAGRTTEVAQVTAVAGFVHRTSRALDPHTHTHVLVANLARGPDGAWSALDGRGVYAHAAATAAVYHAHLRHELTGRLGVTWGPVDRGRADVAGIDLEARRAFSVRSGQIAAELSGRAPGGPRSRDIAALRTRADKDPTLGADDLRAWWHERAAGVGLGPARLGAVVDRAPRRAPELPDPDALGAVLRRGLGARRTTATRRDIVAEAGRALAHGAPLEFLEDLADTVAGALGPSPAGDGRVDGPGVGERRYSLAPGLGHDPDVGRGAEGSDHRAVPDGRLQAAADERRALDRLLRARATTTDLGIGRHGGRVAGRDLGRVDAGRDLGVGLGLGY